MVRHSPRTAGQGCGDKDGLRPGQTTSRRARAGGLDQQRMGRHSHGCSTAGASGLQGASPSRGPPKTSCDTKDPNVLSCKY